jgi:integrase
MEDGRPLDPAYVTRLVQVLRTQGEPLPVLTFHGLRHCYASPDDRCRCDISVVSKLLDHSSISVTADIYAHCSKPSVSRLWMGVAQRIAHTVHSQQAVSG